MNDNYPPGVTDKMINERWGPATDEDEEAEEIETQRHFELLILILLYFYFCGLD